MRWLQSSEPLARSPASPSGAPVPMAEGPESEPDEFGRWTSEVDEDKPDETDPTGPIREYFLW
jgi:hypothetical protein